VCKTTSVTLSPVISGAPVQATSQKRLPQGSDDKSNDFYSYLRSSAQDDSEEAPNSGVRERIAKTEKGEKQTKKKADAEQAIIAPAPPLSITALLGLPTTQKNDVAETGEAKNGEGQVVLALADASSDQQSTANAGAVLLMTGPKADKSQSQKDLSDGANEKVDPAALLSVIAPQQYLDVTSSKESGNLDSANPTSAAAVSKTNGSDVELLTAGTSPVETTSAPVPGNLAFALRLSEGYLDSKIQEHSPEAPPAESIGGAVQVGNTDLATTAQAAADSQLKEQSHQHDGESGATLYEVSQVHAPSTADTPQPVSEQPAHTAAADLQVRQEIANPEPVRNVHMQVIGDNNSRVDVRLMDRGGELHVSVKSGDVNLAQNLQDHMPELTSRLEQQQFQTEVWIPKLADNGKSEMSGTRDFSSNPNNNSHTSDHSDQQGKRQQQYKPDWVDVLENSTRGTGKIDQTWLQ
jgi:hypothetical protein